MPNKMLLPNEKYLPIYAHIVRSTLGQNKKKKQYNLSNKKVE